jgi:hypothetical protein
MVKLNLPHKVCDMTCMWNGIEDQYEWKTGVRVPDHLFFALSGYGNFVYLKQSKANVKRMVFWNTGVTKKMYDFMKDIINFDYKVIEGRSFEYSLRIAKQQIDEGVPIVLGALDMCYLPYYEKFYNNVHVPIHYVMMIGYDDENERVLVHDCGKPNIQFVPYCDLKKAWAVNIPGFSKCNTLFISRFREDINSIRKIVYEGLKRKSENNLNAPVNFIGIKGVKKLIDEFPCWKTELTKEDYEKSLRHIVEYTGTPPMLPPELITSDFKKMKDIPNNHTGARDKLAQILKHYAIQYNEQQWNESADLFNQTGRLISELTNGITEYLLETKNNLDIVPEILTEIVEKEERAYRLINNYLKEYGQNVT